MPGKIKSHSKSSQKPVKLSRSSAPTASGLGKAKPKAPKLKAPEDSVSSGSGSEEEDDIIVDEGDDENDEAGSDDDQEEGEEEEDEGVDEEGMKKLIKALGADGLDDIGRMQLDALEGEDEDDDIGEAEEGGNEQNEGDSNAEEEESSEEDGEEDETTARLSRKEQEGEEEEEEEEEEIALEDAESVDEDAVPRQKIVTNNKVALERIRDSIKLDPTLPWTETLTVTYPETIEVDVNDDLNRELAFYKQALHGATTARTLALQHNLPFTRPADYFAEMVKSDAHMERIRQRLLDEGAAIKRAAEKRKEREGKKYGKQVQIEKMKERERSRKEMEERLKGLKRKHKDALDTQQQGDDEAFDIAVEQAIADPRPSKRAKTSSNSNSKTNKPNLSRKARDTKFGFGTGKGRREKQNTRQSTEQFDFGMGKGAKGKGKGGGREGGKPKRPGKSRRAAMRNR